MESKKQIRFKNASNENLKSESEEIRKQLIILKNINDDLTSKNGEMEKKFKVFLESKDNLNSSITIPNKKGTANVNTSMNNSSYRSTYNQPVNYLFLNFIPIENK